MSCDCSLLMVGELFLVKSVGEALSLSALLVVDWTAVYQLM